MVIFTCQDSNIRLKITEKHDSMSRNRIKELKMMKRLLKFITNILFISALWCAITCGIQAFKCPSLTETQLFLKIPNSFILDFVECEDNK